MQPDRPFTRVTILHSREDVRWQKKLLEHIRATNDSRITVWSECDIGAGANVEHEIEAAIDTADVALLLLSSSFLAQWLESRQHLLDRLFERHGRNLALFPVIVRECPWQEHPLLGALAAFPFDGTAISSLPKARRDGALTQVARSVLRLRRSRFRTLIPEVSEATPDPPSVTTAFPPDPPQRTRRHAGPPFWLTMEPRTPLKFRRDITIGRSLENDICIDDSRVSRRHAKIFWNGAQWLIFDKGSKTGTRLNGSTSPVKMAPLGAKATIHLGSTILRFRTYDPDQESIDEPSSFFESGDSLPDERHLIMLIKNAAGDVRKGMMPALVLFGATIISEPMLAGADPDTLALHAARLIRTLLPSKSTLARLRNDVLATVLWVESLSELEALRSSAESIAPGILSICTVWVQVFSRDRPYSAIENAEGLLRETRITEI